MLHCRSTSSAPALHIFPHLALSLFLPPSLTFVSCRVCGLHFPPCCVAGGCRGDAGPTAESVLGPAALPVPRTLQAGHPVRTIPLPRQREGGAHKRHRPTRNRKRFPWRQLPTQTLRPAIGGGVKVSVPPPPSWFSKDVLLVIEPWCGLLLVDEYRVSKCLSVRKSKTFLGGSKAFEDRIQTLTSSNFPHRRRCSRNVLWRSLWNYLRCRWFSIVELFHEVTPWWRSVVTLKVWLRRLLSHL